MSARVVHFEVPFDDADRARQFLSGRVRLADPIDTEMNYNMVSTGPSTDQGMPSEPGFIGGGMLPRQNRSPRRHHLEVDDIDAAIIAIEKHGGKAVGEKNPVGDMGFAAYFNDSEGNLMGLWQSAG
jgi:predicted enzyme related to lactoylglutathione lyase